LRENGLKLKPVEKKDGTPVSEHQGSGRVSYSHAGRGLGHIQDFLVDSRTWAVRYLVVDTTNLWPGKDVLLSPHWIDA
jgi:hypothetical protein